MNAKSGDWVIVHTTVLKAEERAPQVPDDTKKVPLELWVKGFIQNDANIGDLVNIKTITGRKVSGNLLEVNPYYTHDYGKCIPELLQIGICAKEILFGGVDNE
ncbi:2-amino-4-ketopentanoate thiolase [Romboutsia weinsteinii]|uniref:2-amino-4-ketopentanoate thiolase n=1 Tax=Romboutsia weinsteinii TaxID=2020949 RepID=A0A371J608_9FIRM|nr:2-amino-4-oxopentanoate thiolase subunit OrtA [Romboutsia weinsteinii]RDY28220.1 2-amino-4-ketopentanoate thiolase [Romboutsia weinsteinii]